MEARRFKKNKRFFYFSMLVTLLFFVMLTSVGYAFETTAGFSTPQKNLPLLSKDKFFVWKPVYFLKNLNKKSVFEQKLENLIRADRAIKTSA